MGNGYSVAREDEKEALYQRFARGVAEQRERQERERLGDIEAGLLRRSPTPASLSGIAAMNAQNAPLPSRPPTPTGQPPELDRFEAYIPLMRGVPQVPTTVPPPVPDRKTGGLGRKVSRRSSFSSLGHHREQQGGDASGNSSAPLRSLLEKHERALTRFVENIERVLRKARSPTPSIDELLDLARGTDIDRLRDRAGMGMEGSAEPADGALNLAHASGLRLPRSFVLKPRPGWELRATFPLKTFRGAEWELVLVEKEWDDEQLLRALAEAYDSLRGWRRWMSLRDVAGVNMVLSDHTVIYPLRLKCVALPRRNQRLRYLLRHPDKMRGRMEFMQVLTVCEEYGVEFIEGWALLRIATAVLIPIAGTLVVGIVYAVLSKSVSDAFTLAGYLTSAYAACLVVLGVLNYVDV